MDYGLCIAEKDMEVAEFQGGFLRQKISLDWRLPPSLGPQRKVDWILEKNCSNYSKTVLF
jgi:hypothetical protein